MGSASKLALRLAVLGSASTYVLELTLDGTPAPLRFDDVDDVRAVAAAWSARYPAAGGMDCGDGDASCVVDVLAGAMDALRGEANATGRAAASRRAPSAPARRRSRRADASASSRTRSGPSPRRAATRPSSPSRSPASATAPRTGGARPARAACRRRGEPRRRRADGARVAAAAARLALDLEPRRVVAARFGMMVASEVGDADAGAFDGPSRD
ncbi:hypothetical protein JL720_9653 [Aureococcus anophagefferens]|nr:hypothetical protein JL720_9653 [Aureococcus anophagefferens]